MTHRGPFQPRTFCDSVILCLPFSAYPFKLFSANSANKLHDKEFGLPASPCFIPLAHLQNRKDHLKLEIKINLKNS